MLIDAHTHYFKSFTPTMKGLEAQEFVEGFRALGVDKALVFTLEGFLRDYQKANDELAAIAAHHPDAIEVWGTVDPRDGEQAIAEIGRCVDELGMTGFKFHNWLQAVAAVDPCMFPVMEEIARRQLPVLFHDGTPPYCSTDQVAYLAGQYPDATLILGHSGLNEFARQALRAAVKHENVLLCVCGARYETLKRAVELVGAERIVWGSDFPFGGDGNIVYHRAKVEALPISDDDKEKIFSGNMIRLVPSLAR
jgi:predicted TIM-barrel fold metal-dependent hydrolase